MFGATLQWLSIEILIFYANLVANFLFILLSEFFLKRTGLQYLEKQGNKSDFILKYKTMNGLYQTFSMMLYCTCYCLYRVDYDYAKGEIQHEKLFGIYSLLAVTLIVHLFQFIAMNVQLYASAYSRGRHETLLTAIQVLFIVLIPFGAVIGQVIWLVIERSFMNQIYYNWIISDVCLNSVGTMAYLIQLERIAFEQKESSESFLKLTDKEVPLKKGAAVVPKKLQIG